MQIGLLSIGRVTADYMVSESRLPEEYLDRAVERALAGGMPDSMAEDYRAESLGSPATVMEGTLELLDREYGGAEEYLLASGLGTVELAELRAKLLRPS